MKTIYLMVGPPGSGKSHTAQKLSNNVFSTDDFWGPEYKFDFNKLKVAHQWNINRVREALEAGVENLVVDNTNLRECDRQIYLELGNYFGYSVINIFPDSPWFNKMVALWKGGNPYTKEQIDILVNKGRHNVPRATVENMVQRFISGFCFGHKGYIT